MKISIFNYVLVVLTIAVLSFYYYSRPKNEQFKRFVAIGISSVLCVLAAGIAVDSAGLGFYSLSGYSLRFTALMMHVIYIFSIIFIFYFPDKNPSREAKYFFVVYLLSLFFLLFFTDLYIKGVKVDNTDFVRIEGPLYKYLSALALLYTAIYLVFSIIRSRSSKNKVVKYRILFILTGNFAVLFFGVIFSIAIPHYFGVFDYYAEGTSSALFYLYFMFFALNTDKIISYRISFILLLTVVITMSVFGVYSYINEKKSFTDEIEKNIKLTGEHISGVISDAFPGIKKDEIDIIVRYEMRNPDIYSIKIADAEGTIIVNEKRANGGNARMDFDNSEILGDEYKGISTAISQDGKVVGTVNIVFSDVNVKKQIIKVLVLNILQIIFVSVVLTSILIYHISKIVIMPINKIEEAIEKFSSEDYGVRVQFSSDDEFGKLSSSFNYMAEHIEEDTKKLISLNRSFKRFVPFEFLKFLGCDTVEDLKLGDSTQKDVAIFFLDIRSFTGLAEKLPADEVFDFINCFMCIIGPIIRRNRGIIDKYIGDAIMALFPRSVDDALNAAIKANFEVNYFNQIRKEQGHEPIKFGIGISAGKVMLGTVGEHERMDTTAVSDEVNLTSRLESLTKYYGVNTLISMDSLNKSKIKKKYNYRMIDMARVAGRKGIVKIVEILDSLDEEEFKKRMSTLKEFNKALNYYFIDKNLEKAFLLLEKITEMDPDDHVVKIYLARCENLISAGYKTMDDLTTRFDRK